MKQKTDIYATVTNRIIADLETGVATWHKPWSNGGSTKAMPLRHNGIPYSGVNVLILWGESLAQGYSSPHWLTYRQAKLLNGQVQKGQRATTIVYASSFTKDGETKDGETVAKKIFYLKTYSVFNTSQIDDLPTQYDIPKPNGEQTNHRIDNADAFVKDTGATIYHHGDRAYYAPIVDTITLPPFANFKDGESYYSTALHELSHWSGAATRLDRKLTGHQNEPAYAREELVAELAATFLCATLGIESEPRADHAQYIGHWLAILKEDKRAIFQASSYAQRAADFLRELQPKPLTTITPENAEVAA